MCKSNKIFEFVLVEEHKTIMTENSQYTIGPFHILGTSFVRLFENKKLMLHILTLHGWIYYI